ncbi:hypothetical protein [Delftia acidovorans]|uniref:hypothetical protein n=1 Tax=Delftia acidovorans TaxID=80866 RepID=UPI0018E08612|nr:hypothetical protein [Delftia acidovorans]
MVIRLAIPDSDNDDYIDRVVAQRQGGANAGFFTNLKFGWKTRVQAYKDACGDPCVLKPWPDVHGHAKKFHNLYLSPADDSVQGPVLQSLRSRELQLCPACGEDGTPNTLDHYLPKQSYPEFSITACNLFPMCDICQGKKGTATVNATNQRLFLHPYFDQFTDVQVFCLAIGRPFEAPQTISLEPHAGLGVAQGALVARHLHELGISRRYNHFFKSEYIRLLRLVKSIRQKGQNVRSQLDTFCEYALHKSVNSWGHVFYTGVIADAALMDYLEAGVLPAHL